MIERFGDGVFFCGDDYTRAVGFCFIGGGIDPADDDELVASLCEASGCAVDADDACAGGAGDDVGFEAVAIVAIGDENGFIGEQAGGAEEVGIDGDRAVVVHVGLSDSGAMDFGFEKSEKHLGGLSMGDWGRARREEVEG